MIAVIAFAGAIIFFYPATAAWLSQYDQSKVVVELQHAAVSSGFDSMQRELVEARAYNDELVSGALLTANARKPIAEGAATDDAEYNGLLQGDAAGAMGRLRIPAISVDLPIYHGTSDETLAQGVGHLQGTSLPVGGESQHSVLTAHRGLAEATLFNDLDKLSIGDTFQIEVFGEVLTYSIFETKVVDPENTESLYPRLGEDLVTLVTCTPLGINSHRILVTAQRILPTPVGDIAAAGAAPNIPGMPWWAVGLGGTVLVLGAYVWLMGRPGPTEPPSDLQHS
ncbi:MAG: class C sortase [Leucobacter sp.]